jgi:hypothetical protein
VALDVASGTDATVAAQRADKLVHGDGPVLNNDFAAVKLPKSADPQAVAAGMEALR